MATLLPNGVQQFFDANGVPLAAGTVYFYTPSTDTAKDTYQNAAGTVLNSHPIVLDAAGEAIIYGSGTYRQVVFDAAGNQIWDQITASTDSGAFAWGGVSTGTPNVQAVVASSFSSQDGQQLGFIAGYSNSGALTVNPGGAGAIPVLRDGPSGPTPLVGGEVIAQNEITLVYESARGAFHLTNPAIGTLASQNSNAVAITGGTISGVTISGGAYSPTTLILPNSAAPAPTTTGDIRFGTNQKTIVIGNGSTQNSFWPGVQPGMLWGVTLSNNVADANNDIDFAAGFCTDYSNVSQVTCAALTKRLDANWAAGNNQGMRYSGAAITNATYALWAVWTATGTQDYYADPSAVPATVLSHLQAETGGASYVYLRRVGFIVRTAGAIKAFTQLGDVFTWAVLVQDVSATNPGTSAVTATLTVPTGIVVTAIVTAAMIGGVSGQFYALVTALSQTDTAPGNSAFTIGLNGDFTGPSSNTVNVATNTSGQIRYRASGADAALVVKLQTVGFIDTRGQLA